MVRDGHGQQQYSGRLWGLDDAQLVLRLKVWQENMHLHHYATVTDITDTRQDGSMLSYCL